MSRQFSWALLDEIPVVGILRSVPSSSLEPVLAASVQGGLRNVEITMNSPGAVDQIRKAVDQFGGAMNIGAGTVTSVPLLMEAISAGANFIVTPFVSEGVIRACVNRSIPVFPGAFSPTEIEMAWTLGASLVKVFPAEQNGPAYLRSLKGPLPQVRLMPTGGVDLESIGEFARAGAVAFGVGSPLFRPDRIAAGDWSWLRGRCAAFVDAWQSSKSLWHSE